MYIIIINMAQTLTITVDDAVYNSLKPYIEQQTIDNFISAVIKSNLSSKQVLNSDIKNFRGSLHQIDTLDIREEDDRVIIML